MEGSASPAVLLSAVVAAGAEAVRQCAALGIGTTLFMEPPAPQQSLSTTIAASTAESFPDTAAPLPSDDGNGADTVAAVPATTTTPTYVAMMDERGDLLAAIADFRAIDGLTLDLLPPTSSTSSSTSGTVAGEEGLRVALTGGSDGFGIGGGAAATMVVLDANFPVPALAQIGAALSSSSLLLLLLLLFLPLGRARVWGPTSMAVLRLSRCRRLALLLLVLIAVLVLLVAGGSDPRVAESAELLAMQHFCNHHHHHHRKSDGSDGSDGSGGGDGGASLAASFDASAAHAADAAPALEAAVAAAAADLAATLQGSFVGEATTAAAAAMAAAAAGAKLASLLRGPSPTSFPSAAAVAALPSLVGRRW